MQPNLKCENLKKKNKKHLKGGNPLSRSHVSSSGMNWERPVHTKDQPSAPGALEGAGLILPRVVWEGSGEEVNLVAGSWQTDP